MRKFLVTCAVLLVVSSGCLGLPQRRQQKKEAVQDVTPAHLDPTAIDQTMNDEHMKLIENLQRLKRTLDTVKERVEKGKMESAQAQMKTPENAILAVLESLKQQGELFSMINEMLKAGGEIQNQTSKIEALSKLEEQAKAESVIAEHTNQLQNSAAADSKFEAPKSAPAPSPSVGPTDLTEGPIASASRAPYRKVPSKKPASEMKPQHGYEDYQYQYSDDGGNATGDDQYDYHYDAQGYDTPRSTTTTPTPRPSRLASRRVRTRTRSEYY